jgi:D-alanyl-D-alanine carboxypeptidase
MQLRSTSAGRGVIGSRTPAERAAYLDHVTGQVPGLQYVVVDETGPIYEFAGGWADIRRAQPMTAATTMMGYSLTKTITAVAVLQLVGRGGVALDHELDRFVPDTPYRGRSITVRQLLSHTSGIPNPIPLRWAHLAGDQQFDEAAALAAVLRQNPRLRSRPGERFAYSNLGYWLLGRVVERVTARRFADHLREAVLEPLGRSSDEMGFTIHDAGTHATGYLARYSFLNLAKRLLLDRQYWDRYDGRWLRLTNHELNGPSFGGLVGTARALGTFLADQLRPESALLGEKEHRLLETPQVLTDGSPIPMTLGWHVGHAAEEGYLFKEGGGGGFHGEMRLYPSRGIGSVVIANDTGFDASGFLGRVDGSFGGMGHGGSPPDMRSKPGLPGQSTPSRR